MPLPDSLECIDEWPADQVIAAHAVEFTPNRVAGDPR
jgi:hypothetical protein